MIETTTNLILKINDALKEHSEEFEDLLNKKDTEELYKLCDTINMEIKEIVNK